MAGILFNLLAARAGGQITRANAFFKRFRNYCPDTKMLVLKDRLSPLVIEDSQGVDVAEVNLGAGPLRAYRRLAWENVNIQRIMKEKDLDIYLTFSHYMPSRVGKGVRSVVGVSNLAPFSAEAWNAEGLALRFKMRMLRHSIIVSARRADRVIALSTTCKRILEAHGIDGKTISVIPNGVEIYAENGGDLLAGIPYDKPYILSVSHFHRYKNYERLVDAYAELPGEMRKKHSLVIVGKAYDGSYYRDIMQRVAKSGASSDIIIVPGADRAELQALYRNAGLFVFTSLIENSPNILLEAMAHRLPVLASSLDPMPEFGGDAIRYFDAMSATDIFTKMMEMLENKELAAEYGARAGDRSKMFSWDSFTKSVCELCNK